MKRTLVVTVCLSWVMMNLIALLVESRTEMLLNHDQYKAVYFGDLFCLPGIALAIRNLGLCMPRPNKSCGWWRRFWAKMAVSQWWYRLWIAAALAAGVVFHQWDSSSHFYTRSQTFSPTKLYHDFIVVQGFVYLLFSAGLPALFASRRGWKTRVAIVVLVVVYLSLNHYDALHRPHHGHEDFDWSKFWP